MSLIDEQPHTRRPLPDEDGPSPYRAHRWSGLLALAIIIAFAVALTYVSRSSAPTTPAAPTPVADGDRPQPSVLPEVPMPAPALPAVTRGEVPARHPRTQAGAEAAAANYAVWYGSAAMLATGSRHRVIDAISAPAFRSQLRRETDSGFAPLVSGLGLDAAGNPAEGLVPVYRSTPIGVNTAAYAPEDAQVEVWTVSLFGLAGPDSPKPVTHWWNTTTFDLRWVDDDWRVVRARQREGPTPTSGGQAVTSSAELGTAVDTYGGLRYGR